MAKKAVKKEGLYSLSLDVEHFKNIDKIVVDIGGRSFLFLAKNGGGKSALIQAMMSPMDKKVLPPEPIKEGEERARITHKIGGTLNGEYKEYTMDLYFTQGDKKGRLVITNEKGEAVKSPSTMIKSMIGNVSFDVTKWLNDDKAKKLETIKALTGKGVEIDIINKRIKEIKEDVKYKKKRAEDLEATVANHEFNPDDVEKYSSSIDIDALQSEMAKVSKNQEVWDGIKNKIDGFHKDIDSAQKNISSHEAELIRLKEAYEISRLAKLALIQDEKDVIDKTKMNVLKGEEWVKNNQRPSIDEISNKMNDAAAHNQKFERISQLAEQRREMIGAKQGVDVLLGNIHKLEGERSDIISNSQLPIEGLRFTDEEIFLNDLPLEEGQVNTAKLMEVSIDIAIALNPNYKGIFIHNGNLFDKANIKKIVKKIEDAGYFAVIEMVSYDGNDLEVRFTETEFKQ